MRKFTFGPSRCFIAFFDQVPGGFRATLQVVGSTRQQLSPPHGCPVEIRNSVAGHLKEPGDEALAVLERIGMAMDTQKDLLQDVIGVRITIDPPRDESAQAFAKLRPDLLRI